MTKRQQPDTGRQPAGNDEKKSGVQPVGSGGKKGGGKPEPRMSPQEFLNKFGKPAMQYKLNRLCTSWFNRKGRNLNGSRIYGLAYTFHQAGRGTGGEKFQQYRYIHAIGHECDPDDPGRGARHTNAMAARDQRIRPVEGTGHINLGSKNHLFQSLWGIAGGRLRVGMGSLDGSAADGEVITPPQNQPDMAESMNLGIWVIVVSWEGVRDHPEVFTELMRSDNADHELGLGEDELSDLSEVYELREDIKNGVVATRPNESEFDTIKRLIEAQPGKAPDDPGLVGRYNFSKVVQTFCGFSLTLGG